MQALKNILNHVLVLITLTAFVVSTSGFTFYSHKCDNKVIQSSIVGIHDCCEDKTPEVLEIKSCCSADPEPEPVVVPHCGTNCGDGECCVTEFTYHKLSVEYVHSSSQDNVEVPICETVTTTEVVEEAG